MAKVKAKQQEAHEAGEASATAARVPKKLY
jgi:hypothetical protein